MALGYTYEYRNPGFPTTTMSRGSYQDVSDGIGNLINEINAYRKQGRYDSAAALIRQNADVLSKVTIGASTINGLIEEIRNAQLYALEAQQEIFVGEIEPDSVSDKVIWIGGE